MTIDKEIKKKADDIRNKIYGKEVRESLASGLEAMSSDVVENEGRQSVVEGRQDSVESQWQSVSDEMTDKDVISAPEIIAARNGESNLKTRLDKEKNEVTAQLAQKATQTSLDITNASVIEFNDRVDNIIATPTTVSEQEIIDARQNKASLGANLTAIKDDFKKHSDIRLTNLLENGNFKVDSAGWVTARTSVTKTENGLLVTPTADNTTHIIQKYIDFTPVVGDSYYFRVKISNIIDSLIAVALYNQKADESWELKLDTLVNGETVVSGIFKPTSVHQTPTFFLRINLLNSLGLSSYPGTTESVTIKEVSVINISNVFGEIYEWDKKDMDTFFNNEGWFDGEYIFSQKQVINKVINNSSTNNIVDDVTGISYKWEIGISNGIPNILLKEIL